MPSKRRIGQVVRIDLYNGYFTYGYEINHGDVVILDIMTQDDIATKDIIKHPRLFTVGVLNSDYKSWQVVGDLELETWQAKRPDKFIQDPIDLSLYIIDDSGNRYPTTFEKAKELERATGWSNFQVEQRVRDHFAGKTNIIKEIERPKPPDASHYSPGTHYVSTPGAIKQISLNDGTYVFGREFPNTFITVYDSRTESRTSPKDLIERPIICTVSVSLSARIGWENVGFLPLIDNEDYLPKRYLRIGSKPTDILIYPDPYDPDFKSYPGTVEDAVGLEPAIMWDNYQVENRIRAYYSDKPWDLELV
ncbi:hypothetical protein G4Y79_05060 [Phototrophicus methaneseepsis]|uniref:Immunity protein 26 n=1 Tax=Phototrophicus methaneseepsis TaxID=2710758 RepID=A0A7S8EBE1_9CHLR|nr:hypothetical protein [Phototrophicus methaneseepsis]QPC83749.1 hypothetical protein G4Y79_05060 [Phototrophicus methaneseepsis]